MGGRTSASGKTGFSAKVRRWPREVGLNCHGGVTLALPPLHPDRVSCDMDTHSTPSPPQYQSLSSLHLFVLSVAVGFCISFGGSLVFATQISVRADDGEIRSELVRDATDDTVPVDAAPTGQGGSHPVPRWSDDEAMWTSESVGDSLEWRPTHRQAGTGRTAHGAG